VTPLRAGSGLRRGCRCRWGCQGTAEMAGMASGSQNTGARWIEGAVFLGDETMRGANGAWRNTRIVHRGSAVCSDVLASQIGRDLEDS
jgi:hypothetical protein